MRALNLSEFISSVERLFSSLQLVLNNLVLKRALSSDVVDKSKELPYSSSNSVIKLELSICLGAQNYNTNRNNMQENPLLYAGLSFQVLYC